MKMKQGDMFEFNMTNINVPGTPVKHKSPGLCMFISDEGSLDELKKEFGDLVGFGDEYKLTWLDSTGFHSVIAHGPLDRICTKIEEI